MQKNKYKNRKIIFCLTLVLTTFIFSTINVFADVDTSWYVRNTEILEKHSIGSSIFRTIGWAIIKMTAWFSSTIEKLFDKSFGMLDLTNFSNYPSLAKILTQLQPVLIALTVLSVMYLGMSLMIKKERPPLLRNIVMIGLVLSCSTYMFMTANSLVTSFKDGMLEKDGTQAYISINNNTLDLIKQKKKIKELDYSKSIIPCGMGLAGTSSKSKNGTIEKRVKEVEINDTLNHDDSDKGQDLYKWSDDFQEIIEHKKVMGVDDNGNQTWEQGDIEEGWFGFGDEFYYRYEYNFLPIVIEHIAQIILFFALTYKVVRTVFELVFSRIFAYMYASDITSGERLKQILFFIRDTYICLCASIMCVKLYTILCGLIGQVGFQEGSLEKALMCVFLAYCVIDGPNLCNKLLGIDAGLSSSVGRAMAVWGMAKTGAKIGTGAVLGRKGNNGKRQGGIVGKAKDIANNHNPFEEKQESSKSAGGDIDTNFMSANSKDNAKGNTFAGGNSKEDTNKEVNNTSQAKEPTMNTEKNNVNDPNSDFNTDFMSTGNATNTNGNSFDFNDNNMSTANSGSKNNGSFMNENVKQGSEINSPSAFSNAIKELSPSPSASKEERQDWNKQINSIVRSKNHSAIKPKEGASDYQLKNYEKAKKVEKAYKSHPKYENKNNDKGDKK